MADIELVIKIPEEMYKNIQNKSTEIQAEGYIVENAILNGAPLPKGHGRLIDAEDIALIDEQFYVPSDYYVAESAINDAPTIIEAEGSDSE